jgi:TonB family protein
LIGLVAAACSSGASGDPSARDAANEIPAPAPLPRLGGSSAEAGPAALEQACTEGDAAACAARAASGDRAGEWRARACVLGDRPSCDSTAIEALRATLMKDAISAARAAGPDTPEAEHRRGPRVWLRHIAVLDGGVASTGEMEPRFRNGLHRSYERCYKALARQENPPRGDIAVAMTIDHGGKLAKVAIANSFAPELDDCVVRATEAWSFAALAVDRGARLVLTAVFEP